MNPINPLHRDPRIAAVEAGAKPAGESRPVEQQSAEQQPGLLERAIPQEGTPEHAEYVVSLLNRIKELETTSTVGGLPRTLGLRVSPKGAVSVYGVNANFPVSLYPEQWHRLFESDNQRRILDFIEANKDVL